MPPKKGPPSKPATSRPLRRNARPARNVPSPPNGGRRFDELAASNELRDLFLYLRRQELDPANLERMILRFFSEMRRLFNAASRGYRRTAAIFNNGNVVSSSVDQRAPIGTRSGRANNPYVAAVRGPSLSSRFETSDRWGISGPASESASSPSHSLSIELRPSRTSESARDLYVRRNTIGTSTNSTARSGEGGSRDVPPPPPPPPPSPQPPPPPSPPQPPPPSNDNVGCAICLDTESEYVSLERVLCGHVFHATCLTTWLRHNDRCPICRTQVAARRRFGVRRRLSDVLGVSSEQGAESFFVLYGPDAGSVQSVRVEFHSPNADANNR